MTEPTPRELARALQRLSQRLDVVEAELRELRASPNPGSARLISPADLGPGEEPDPRQEEIARHTRESALAAEAARIRAGEAVFPPPAEPGRVTHHAAEQVRQVDSFIGWVFPFPTGEGHVLCSTDLTEPFGLRMEVQMRDGRRYRCTYEQLERRS